VKNAAEDLSFYQKKHTDAFGEYLTYLGNIVKKLLSMIDETKILMPTICGPNHIDWCFFDKAEDNHHPGPINHSVFARKLFEFYENNKDIL